MTATLPHNLRMTEDDRNNIKDFSAQKEYTFGVEIEAYAPYDNVGKIRDALMSIGVQTGTDGSIHPPNNNEGFESRTMPFTLNASTELFTKICKILKRNRAGVGVSTGLHVHVGNVLTGEPSKDMSEKDAHLLNYIIKFVSIHEADIFGIMPKSRRENKYCKKYDEYYFKDTETPRFRNMKKLEQKFYETKRENFMDSLKREHGFEKRYYGLNIHSYFYRGTIEFRYHSGTIDKNKILNWVKLIDSMIKYCKNTEKDGYYLAKGRCIFEFLHKQGYISKKLLNYFHARKKQFGETRGFTHGTKCKVFKKINIQIPVEDVELITPRRND